MKRLHLICNAHLDPIWQWTWDEGISSAIATFKSAADLADEYDYIFCHGESLLYEAIENYAPELFKRIQKLVKIGKWKITGGWYLQPDCLMPSGESISRQIEVGQEYFLEKFGVKPEVATNYDSFGHSIGLVQIMAKHGYKGYLICRPRKDSQIKYPSKFFKWESLDGSSLIVSNSSSYNSVLGDAVGKIKGEIDGGNTQMLGSTGKGNKKTLDDVDYVLWGVGNHGGGPSRKDLKDIENLKVEGYEIFHSTPEKLISEVKPKGSIKSSLITCMPGCYTSMAKVKKLHRETESLLYATEKMLTVAMLSGMKVDLQDLKKAEKKFLLCEFHDIMAGTCVKAGEDEGLELLSYSKKVLNDYRTKAFSFLTMSDSVAKDGEIPVFVFNYMPYEVETPVEAEFMLADQNWSEEFVYLPKVYLEDKEIPCQQIKEESTINLDWRKKIVFRAKLKPMSITRFSVRVQKTEIKKIKKDLRCGEVDKNIKLCMYDDSADPWAMSDEELAGLGKNEREFRPMTVNEVKKFIAVEENLKAEHVIENGDVYTATEKFLTLDGTNAVIEQRDYKHFGFVDYKITVEFAEKNKLLRLKIPVPQGKVIGDGPFVVEEKPLKQEMYFQKWVGVKEKGGKVFAIINDGIYGGKAEDGYISLTLLRGAGYCIHPVGRQLYPHDRYLPRIESGRYVYNIRIMKGTVDEVSLEAELFNQKPYAVNVFPVGGKIKNTEISTDKKIILSSLRPSGDGKATMRLFNPTENDKTVKVKVNNKQREIVVKKYEFTSVDLGKIK